MNTKTKPIKRKQSVIFALCMILCVILLTIIPSTDIYAASDHFHATSITGKSWKNIKPKVTKWVKQGIAYCSPCAGLIDTQHETAYGLDCSGFVNTMVHLYYDDKGMEYDWNRWFSSGTWAPCLEQAGLKVLQGTTKEEFNQAYRKGIIQDGDVIVFSNWYCRGVHVALVYGNSNAGVLLAHAYGNHLQTTTFNNVHTWDFGAGTYTYYEVFAGSPRKTNVKAKTTHVTKTKQKLKHKWTTIASVKRKAQWPKKISYKLTASKKYRKYFRVTKNGIVQIRKTIPKGTYKIHVTRRSHNMNNNVIRNAKKTIKIKVK